MWMKVSQQFDWIIKWHKALIQLKEPLLAAATSVFTMQIDSEIKKKKKLKILAT